MSERNQSLFDETTEMEPILINGNKKILADQLV